MSGHPLRKRAKTRVLSQQTITLQSNPSRPPPLPPSPDRLLQHTLDPARAQPPSTPRGLIIETQQRSPNQHRSQHHRPDRGHRTDLTRVSMVSITTRVPGHQTQYGETRRVRTMCFQAEQIHTQRHRPTKIQPHQPHPEQTNHQSSLRARRACDHGSSRCLRRTCR